MLRNLEALLCIEVNTAWRRGLHVGHFVEIFLINLCHFKKNDIYCAKKLWHFSGFPIGTGMDGMGRISVEETVDFQQLPREESWTRSFPSMLVGGNSRLPYKSFPFRTLLAY